MDKPVAAPGPLVDQFAREISYLRLSVTDRCNLRCSYCMDENVVFVPRHQLLSLEELDRLASCFVSLGVRKIRLTGGEPLVRKDILWLIKRISRHLDTGALHELTMTSNATQLQRYAGRLAQTGIRRLNISLDTRDSDKFRQMSRLGELSSVLDGIGAARQAGLKIKLNMVVIRGFNDNEIVSMMEWAHAGGMDLTLIEVMPFGNSERWLPNLVTLDEIKDRLAEKYTLEESDLNTGGPARYLKVRETGGRLGLITPLSGNFCQGCNRVRVTCRGRLYQCLGREKYVDLRAVLHHVLDDEKLARTIREAVAGKPEGHDFAERRQCGTPVSHRNMTDTGG